jgi:hypothetical protein
VVMVLIETAEHRRFLGTLQLSSGVAVLRARSLSEI